MTEEKEEPEQGHEHMERKMECEIINYEIHEGGAS